MHHYDTDVRIICFLEDACQKSELSILDSSVHDSPVRISRVQSHENRPSDPGYGIELLRNERPIVAKRSEQPLMDPVERDVVVPGRDNDGHIQKLPEVRAGLLKLADLGSLREVPGQGDHIGRHFSRYVEKASGHTRLVRFAEV